MSICCVLENLFQPRYINNWALRVLHGVCVCKSELRNRVFDRNWDIDIWNNTANVEVSYTIKRRFDVLSAIGPDRAIWANEQVLMTSYEHMLI